MKIPKKDNSIIDADAKELKFPARPPSEINVGYPIGGGDLQKAVTLLADRNKYLEEIQTYSEQLFFLLSVLLYKEDKSDVELSKLIKDAIEMLDPTGEIRNGN